jgi:hypothetical protein
MKEALATVRSVDWIANTYLVEFLFHSKFLKHSN